VNLHDLGVTVFFYVMQSGLLLLAGLLLPSLLGLRDPRIRLYYWRLLIPVVLLLPVLPAWLPGMLAHDSGAVIEPLPELSMSEVVNAVVPSSTITVSLPMLLAVVMVGFVLRMVWIGLGLVTLRLYRRHGRELQPVPAAVQKLWVCFRLPVRFLVSGRVTSPVTYGWRRPTVLVPEGFERLSGDQQAGVACHELLHVARRDWLVVMSEEILRALLWFHPAVGILLDRITLSREQVIDSQVIDLTGNRRAYLEALYSIACSPRGGAAVPFLNRSHLRQRVALITREVIMSRKRLFFSLSTLVTVMVTVAGLGAAAFPLGSGRTAIAEEIAGSITGTVTGPVARPVDHASVGVGEDELVPDLDADAEITAPKAIHKVEPVYPEQARKERRTGSVRLEAVITEEGNVTRIKVRSTTDEVFSQAAIDAVKQWRFEPATADGKPVAVYYVLTVNFNLDDLDEPK
jgi:TonB family protein